MAESQKSTIPTDKWRYDTTILHKIGHGGKPKTHDQYPTWCHHG
jgi:hypothetical protein